MFLREAGDSRVVSEMGMCCLSRFSMCCLHAWAAAVCWFPIGGIMRGRAMLLQDQWFCLLSLLTLTVHTATCFKKANFVFCAFQLLCTNYCENKWNIFPTLARNTNFQQGDTEIISTCQSPGLVSNEAKKYATLVFWILSQCQKYWKKKFFITLLHKLC